jgi:hypothetical protein
LGIFDIFRSTPSPKEFAKLLKKAAVDGGYSESIEFDANEFRFLIGEQGSRVFNLHNAYRDYCGADKQGRKLVVTSYLAAMSAPETPVSYAEAEKKLMPILRGRGTPEYVRLTQLQNNGMDRMAFRPFSQDTVLMLAFDREHAIQTLSESTLRDWGVSFEQALAAASENLRAQTISNFDEIVPGVFLGAWDDAYETSRILFPDLVYQLDVGSDPVMMIPTRSRFIATSSANTGALLAMLEFSKSVAAKEGRAVSALMYRFDNGHAVEYLPADPDVADKLAELKMTYLAEDYAAQKDMLDKLHEKDQIDIYVAGYQKVRDDRTGLVASISIWTENIDTLLPETDLVALGMRDEAGELAGTKIVKWADLKSIGGVPAADDGYPPRYRVMQFPGKEKIDALPDAEQ